MTSGRVPMLRRTWVANLTVCGNMRTNLVPITTHDVPSSLRRERSPRGRIVYWFLLDSLVPVGRIKSDSSRILNRDGRGSDLRSQQESTVERAIFPNVNNNNNNNNNKGF